MKMCPRCGEEKPATTEYFHRNSQTRDKLHVYCKVCKAEIHRKYMADPEVHQRVVQKIRIWRNGMGRDKYCAYRREYDKSPKRVAWRRKRFYAVDGERNLTIEQALEALERRKEGAKK